MSSSARLTWKKLTSVISEELQGVNPKLQALEALVRMWPQADSDKARAAWYRKFGFQLGEGTLLRGTPRLTGPLELARHLVVGKDCTIEGDVVFDLEEHITVGDRATLGPGVMILTSTHELGPKEHRAGPVTRSPVVIGAGAHVGARSIILPGVTIGAGAVVNPGSVVNKDVAPHTRVGGSPLVVLETLGDGTDQEA
jgi:maltose O-acetyltransferase